MGTYYGNTYIPSTCPKCGSSDYTETARVEICHDCGYEQYYEDAHNPRNQDNGK